MARTNVLRYIKLLHAKFLNAYIAFVILSIVTPEWFSICHWIGSLATRANIVHKNHSATWKRICSSQTRAVPWNSQFQNVSHPYAIKRSTIRRHHEAHSCWMILSTIPKINGSTSTSTFAMIENQNISKTRLLWGANSRIVLNIARYGFLGERIAMSILIYMSLSNLAQQLPDLMLLVHQFMHRSLQQVYLQCLLLSQIHEFA